MSTVEETSTQKDRRVVYIVITVALVLLLIITDFAWIALLFPFWVLLVSGYILVADYRQRQQGAVRRNTS